MKCRSPASSTCVPILSNRSIELRNENEKQKKCNSTCKSLCAWLHFFCEFNKSDFVGMEVQAWREIWVEWMNASSPPCQCFSNTRWRIGRRKGVTQNFTCVGWRENEVTRVVVKANTESYHVHTNIFTTRLIIEQEFVFVFYHPLHHSRVSFLFCCCTSCLWLFQTGGWREGFEGTFVRLKFLKAAIRCNVE